MKTLLSLMMFACFWSGAALAHVDGTAHTHGADGYVAAVLVLGVAACAAFHFAQPRKRQRVRVKDKRHDPR